MLVIVFQAKFLPKRLVTFMENCQKRLLAACISLTFVQIANADESIRWNGYLNVVGGILKDAPRNDTTTEKQYPGHGTYEHQLTFDSQTSGALQATKVLDEKMYVTAQAYAEGSTNGYDANLKWFYLTYNPDDSSSFRVGRIGMPLYFYSDFLNVGFTYQWVSPPIESYQYDTSLTGIDYVYRGVSGNFEWTAETYFGAINQFIASLNGDVNTRNTTGLNLMTVYDGWLTLRVNGLSQKATLINDALNAEDILDGGLAQAQSQMGLPNDLVAAIRSEALPILQRKFDLDNVSVKYYGVFVKADFDSLSFATEWNRSDTPSYLLNYYDSWYVTGAYRINDVLFHLTYSTVESELAKEAVNDSNATLGGFTPDALGSYFASQIGANVAAASARKRHAVSAGVRIDTTANTALKFEVTQFEERETLPNENAGIGKNLLFRTALNVTF